MAPLERPGLLGLGGNSAEVLGLNERTAGDEERPGPGDSDMDLSNGPLGEWTCLLSFDEARNPGELLCTEDMARGFPLKSIFPPGNVVVGKACESMEGRVSGMRASSAFLLRGEEGIAKGMPVLPRLELRRWLASSTSSLWSR